MSDDQHPRRFSDLIYPGAARRRPKAYVKPWTCIEGKPGTDYSSDQGAKEALLTALGLPPEAVDQVRVVQDENVDNTKDAQELLNSLRNGPTFRTEAARIAYQQGAPLEDCKAADRYRAAAEATSKHPEPELHFPGFIYNRGTVEPKPRPGIRINVNPSPGFADALREMMDEQLRGFTSRAVLDHLSAFLPGSDVIEWEERPPTGPCTEIIGRLRCDPSVSETVTITDVELLHAQTMLREMVVQKCRPAAERLMAILRERQVRPTKVGEGYAARVVSVEAKIVDEASWFVDPAQKCLPPWRGD